jgi:hypothetical protein
MTFDFSSYRLRNRAYSEKPMTILDPEPGAMLSAITEIALIETGSLGLLDEVDLKSKIQVSVKCLNPIRGAGAKKVFYI